MVAAVAFALLAPPSALLYDGASNVRPNDLPWLWGFAGTSGTVIGPGGSQKTTLDTLSDAAVQAGWLTVCTAPLDPAKAPSVTFDLRIVEERHSDNDRAGASVIVVCHDKRGVELSFWQDRVWAQDDEPIFTHGEEAACDTTAFGSGRAGLRRYTLSFTPGSYRLTVDGLAILTGPRRDYSAFNGFPDPYEIPDVLWVGDDTHAARSRLEFSYFRAQSGVTAAIGTRR